MKKTALYLFALALLSAACSHNGKNAFTIEGTIQDGNGKCLILEELTPDGALFIDSIAIDKNGHYKYRYNMPYPSFYKLCHDSNDYVMLRPAAGDHIVVDAQYGALANTYTVSGSPESTLLWQLQRYSDDGTARLREIVAADYQNRQALASNSITQKQYDATHKELDSIFLDAYKEQQDYIVQFLKDNQGSLTTIIALYKPFNNHPLIDPKVNFDYYEMVLDGLEETYPDNPHTTNFKNTVEHLRHRYGQPKQAAQFELLTNDEE